MQIRFDRQFYKDLTKINDNVIALGVQEAILAVQAAQTLSEIHNIKKLKGFKNAYRIRIGSYRIGLVVIEDNIIDFVRILNRKNIYRFFP